MTPTIPGSPVGDPSSNPGVSCDAEDQPAASVADVREQMLDNTIADSFPNSDPPSTIPDPGDASTASDPEHRELLRGLPPGSWAAIALDEPKVAGTGATRDQAEQDARQRGFPNVELVEVPADSDAPMQAPDAA